MSVKRARLEAIWRGVIDQGVEQGRFRTGGGMVTKDLLGMHNYSYVWIDPEGDCRPIEELGAMCTGLNVASARLVGLLRVRGRSHNRLTVKEPIVPHVTLAGDLTGEYLVREQRPDGTLLLAPNETSLEAVRRRHGLRRLTSAEFEAFLAEHGDQMLPLDGEG